MGLTLLFPPSLGDAWSPAHAERLEAWLSAELGETVVVRIARTYAELGARLRAADAELVWAPPVLCAQAEPEARAILKAVRGGRSGYRAALVCRAAESLDLASLQGRRAAWVDRLSSAGYLLPVAYLRSQGLDPDALFSSQTFASSYRAALRAVLAGEADLAGVHTAEPNAESVAEALGQHVGVERAELTPFAFTDETPSDGLVITPLTTHEMAEAIAKRLLGYHLGAGPNVLLAILGAEGLERAGPNDYAVLAHRGAR